MSFEPKIFSSEEPAPCAGSQEQKLLGEPAAPLWNDADELELPADLAMLAEQLRDDAQYLAQRHPAHATPEQRSGAWAEVEKSAAPKPRFVRVYWWASGGAAAAVLMGASWIGWQWKEREITPPNDAFVAASPKDSGVLQQSRVETVTAQIQPADTGRSPESRGSRIQRLPDNSPRLMPAGFLQDVSGPELDAMLELLSEQSDAGFSI